MSPIREVSVQELKSQLDAGTAITLIDVREPSEKEIADIGGELIPLGSLGENLDRVPRNGDVVVYCRSGGRSAEAVALLQDEHQYSNVASLAGGILAWADEVDPTITKY